MGRRGPIPKTDEIRRLEGNPSKRPMKGKSPKPQGIPSCPEWLSQEGKREWRRVVPELTRLGMITKLDQAMLSGYCSLYGHWRRAQKILHNEGTVYVTHRGELKPRPEVEIARTFGELVKGFAAELGMTPLSRQRIRILQPEKELSIMETLLRESEQEGKR